jgi:hypothetical protein
VVTKSRKGPHRSMNDSRSAVPVLADLVQAPVGHPWAVDWSAVETKLGSGLPSDYKEYVARFGPGFLEEGYILVAMPGIPDDWGRNYEFFDHVRLGSVRLRASRERVAYPIWPEPGGLLSWGATDYADMFYWDTSPGHPDRWTVVATTRGRYEWFSFAGSMSQFLVALLTRRIVVPFLVADLGAPPRPFEPDDRRSGK